MLKKYIIALFLLLSINSIAQDINRKGFGTPFDFPLYLSGNFGELRSNHFHGGLDFKTQHQSGKKLLALADGYISRVRVTHGSGYVVHTVYENGFSTISRHLMGFVSPIAELVDSIQYANQSWEIDLNFNPGEHPIKKGEQVAWSGNMGYSFAPHLHLDVFENASGDQIDPLPFFSTRLKDTTAPKAKGFMLFPQLGKGVINHSTQISTIAIQDNQTIPAWGLVGVGIKAFDYMDGVSNNYGVKHLQLYVDGELTFESNVDRFADDESRYINSWTYKNYMKTFIEPGNKLRMLKAHNETRGLLNIDKERIYQLRFVLTDYYGNKSTYFLALRGEKQTIYQPQLKTIDYLAWNKANIISRPGMNLFIPAEYLYDSVYLDFKILAQTPSSASFTYQLCDLDTYIPLHRSADLILRVIPREGLNVDQLYVARLRKNNKWSSVGGKYKEGFMHAKISELGTYAVLIDSIPPIVTAQAKERWAKNGEVVFSAKDKESGIASYRGTIDGEYALFYLDIMPDKIRYKLDSKRLQKGKRHKVQLEVVDNSKNRTFIEEEFFW